MGTSNCARLSIEDDELLTVGEVAARFGVANETVRQWSRAGALPYIRAERGERRFRRSDVRATIAEASRRP